MSTATFRAIALSTLLLVALAVRLSSPTVSDRLVPLVPEHPVAMGVLAVALTALAFTLVWAVLLLPLRARSPLGTLRGELEAVQARGGMAAAVREEQVKLEAARTGDARVRRRYHGSLAAAGLFVSAISILVVFVLWAEDRLGLEPILWAVIAPGLTLWHAAQYVWCSQRR